MMTLKPILVASVATIALVGCDTASVDGDPNRRTKTGAAIGGVIGALIGSSSSDDKLAKGTVGAVIGASVGGVIGQQLDKQAQDLRRDIPNQDIQIENTGSELRVTMPQDLLFDVDSSFVRGDLQADLRALAGNLQQYPDTTVIITGHTDNTGSDSYNYALSEDRAAAVGSVLTNAGVGFDRVRTFGRGEEQPIASNETEQGRALNRRVEIVIRPNNI